VRRRVLQATIAAVTVAVVLLGFPLAFLGAQLVRENAVQQLQARVDSAATASTTASQVCSRTGARSGDLRRCSE
jgi:outer membrane lipoprotein-sorting protein